MTLELDVANDPELTNKRKLDKKKAPITDKKYRMDPEYIARNGLDEKTYKQRMKLQPALGNSRE